MNVINNKKTSIILILKILEEFSDENHFLTQNDISEKLDFLYGIKLERKSVSNNIKLLQELDYDIVKSSKGGYALFSRIFNSFEARFLNDAIFSSKSITGNQAIELTNKVNSCLSKYQRGKYNYLFKSTEVSRTANKDIFLTIELIEEAIEKRKRISFQYLTYDENGKPMFRREGFRFIVSPYYSINNFGRYYLLCNYREKYHPLQIFRIDYMVNPQIEDEWPIKPMSQLKGINNFDISKYVNEHVYLFGSEIIDATVEIVNPSAIQYVDDWFGKKAKIYKKDNKLFADIRSNEDAFFYWVVQYNNDFRVISPEIVKQRLIKYFKEGLEKYGIE